MPSDLEPISEPDRRFGVRTLLLAAAAALVAVPFLALLLLVEDRSTALEDIDAGARDGLHGYAVHHRLFVSMMRLLSDSGTSLAWTVIFLPVVGWLLWRRLPRLAAFVMTTVAVSSLLNNVVKLLVHRTRPVLRDSLAHAGGASFPSGHAQAAIVGYGVLILIFRSTLRGVWRHAATVAGVVMVLAIGFSRVALGLHYVSDVLAGYLLGGAWVVAMTAAFSAWQRERGLPAVEPDEGLSPDLADGPAPKSGRPQ